MSSVDAVDEMTACLDTHLSLSTESRGRMEVALDVLGGALPDVLNHNMETVPRLYKQARPGADYMNSLKLLKDFRSRFPNIPTKSGLMLGLGETNEEILKLLTEISRSGRTVVMATHNYPIIEKFPARIVKFENGRVTELA